MADPVVANNSLLERDLANLGTAFTNHFAVRHDDIFAELLEKIDRAEAGSHNVGAVPR